MHYLTNFKKKYHSNRSAALRMHLTSIHKCIFDIAHCAVTRTNLQTKFCSSLIHLTLMFSAILTCKGKFQLSGLNSIVSAASRNYSGLILANQEIMTVLCASFQKELCCIGEDSLAVISFRNKVKQKGGNLSFSWLLSCLCPAICTICVTTHIKKIIENLQTIELLKNRKK